VTSPDLIALIEQRNELAAERRGVELEEDEALEVIKYCNERRPMLDELISACDRQIEDLRAASDMAHSDKLWTIKKIREWCNFQ